MIALTICDTAIDARMCPSVSFMAIVALGGHMQTDTGFSTRPLSKTANGGMHRRHALKRRPQARMVKVVVIHLVHDTVHFPRDNRFESNGALCVALVARGSNNQ